MDINAFLILQKREKVQRYRLVLVAFVVAFVFCYIGYLAENQFSVKGYHVLLALAAVAWCVVELISYAPKKKNMKLLKHTVPYTDLILDESTVGKKGIRYGENAFVFYRRNANGRLKKNIIIPYALVQAVDMPQYEKTKIHLFDGTSFAIYVGLEEATELVESKLKRVNPNLVVR